MKRIIIPVLVVLFFKTTNAQIGIGTTSPNSTLDVRGSFSSKYTSFSGNTTAASDVNMVFTGTSAATLTLPDATTCQGRSYWVKSTSSNSSTLTIATTSSQTIDGVASWSLTQTNKVVCVLSNGTNWIVVSESLPGASAGTPWIYGGNNVTSQQNIGTTSNYHLPFITNNTEKMRLTSTGNLGIGTSTFNGSYPEKLIVDAGTNGSGQYQNVIVGKGNTNSYAQLNIQNNSTGTAASSDVVATANNGSETVNFIDMGINGSGNTSTGVLGGANTAYLYTTGNDFSIGNASNNRHLNFFTTSASTSSERMRITSDGDVGIGTSSPNYQLHMHKTSSGSNWMQITNSATGTGSYNGFFYGVNATGRPQLWGQGDMDIVTGSGTTNNTTMTLTEDGYVGVNTNTFSGTNPERLLVNAGSTGSTSYQNVIVGKGNTNSYAQLNIQNNSGGTAASSDVVATANNGSETANFIDMGINSSGNTSTGVLGGANTAYLYTTGNDFAIGNGSNSRNLNFFTTTGGTYTERMRVTSAGNVGIGNTSPAEKLDITGNVRFSGALMPGGNAGTAGHFLVSTGAGSAPTWFDAGGYAWLIDGNTVSGVENFGTKSNHDLPFITNNTEKMRITATGSIGIGTTTFSGTNPEKLIVDAGTNGSGAYQNVIVGKGNTNSYAQLNIQNGSTGTAASSDVVATANNGNETVNFIDMGINGGGNTSSGILGGANTAYLYATGNDFVIGNSTNAKDLSFYTTSSSTSTERMTILSTGNVGIASANPNSTLQVGGSMSLAITTKTANYTATASDYTIVCNNSGGITITLPAASGATGRIYVIKKISGAFNNVTIDGNASETIDGSTTRLLTVQYESVMIQCDGSNWHIISKN